MLGFKMDALRAKFFELPELYRS
jgi:hypothetical protein